MGYVLSLLLVVICDEYEPIDVQKTADFPLATIKKQWLKSDVDANFHHPTRDDPIH